MMLLLEQEQNYIGDRVTIPMLREIIKKRHLKHKRGCCCAKKFFAKNLFKKMREN
jgi:hypothetical protein